MLDWLSRNGIRTPQSVFVAPNPYTEHTDADRPPREIDHDHLIFFGLLATRKGLHVFGDALRQLRREAGPLPRTLSFLGTLDEVNGRPAAEYLETLRQDLAPIEFHVINHLDHLGAREYIEQTRGLVVIPSLLENCPFVVIECIENGFPFLAARTGGIPDMVDPKATFEPTPAALAARLGERHSIDHAAMRHPYSAREAAQVWRDLHGDGNPLGVTARRTPELARNDREPTRVSVCIRFSEDSPYLERVVAAFADQRYPDLEVVVVNHGSGPKASREFDRVAAGNQDGRFRFVTIENEGPGAARNLAADRATGDLLLFFDAADLPKTPDFVATLVRALHRSEADCLTCACDIVGEDRLQPGEGDVTSIYRPIGGCLEVGFFQNVLGDATMILSRTVFAQLGGFPVKRASWEVQEFLLRLCFRGFRLETFPEALFYYRESASGRSRQANYFLEFQSLFEQLEGASRAELARIMETVGGPTLVARLGAGFAHLIGR
jgi:GT2 family glycosyltransferase